MYIFINNEFSLVEPTPVQRPTMNRARQEDAYLVAPLRYSGSLRSEMGKSISGHTHLCCLACEVLFQGYIKSSDFQSRQTCLMKLVPTRHTLRIFHVLIN